MTTLYDRALKAMEDRIDEVQAKEAEEAAESLRNRIAIFAKEQQMFRELTEALLGEPLELSMDPETGKPIPVPVSDLVSLTIEYTNGLWDYWQKRWEKEEYVYAKPHMWNLKALSCVGSPIKVKSLADLGSALVAAQDQRDWLDKEEGSPVQSPPTPSRPTRYIFADESGLNTLQRPFTVIGSPVADPETSNFFVLIQFTDIEA